MMETQSDSRVPTPLLDDLRPRVLEALRIHGWTCAPSQFGVKFVVRARRDLQLSVLEFTETAHEVVFAKTCAAENAPAVADLRSEGVLS